MILLAYAGIISTEFLVAVARRSGFQAPPPTVAALSVRTVLYVIAWLMHSGHRGNDAAAHAHRPPAARFPDHANAWVLASSPLSLASPVRGRWRQQLGALSTASAG